MDDNDYELLILSQEDNEDAINALYSKYKSAIKSKSKNVFHYMKNYGVEINDIMQEGFLGLDYAIKNYSQNSDASFATFANLCIDSKIFNFCRVYSESRHSILNNAIMIDEYMEKMIKDDINIEEIVLNNFNDYDFITGIRGCLSDLEKNVFDLRLYGYQFKDLARILKKDNKAIYNALNRIKIKIKNYQELDTI